MFDFNPYEAIIDVKLAAKYQPKNLVADVKYRPYNGLLCILNGQYHYTMKDGYEITASSGDIIYLPKNLSDYRYEITCDNDSPSTVQLEFEVAEAGEKLTFGNRPIVLDNIDNNAVTLSMNRIVTAYSSLDLSMSFSVLSNIYEILSVLEGVSENNTNSRLREIVLPAVMYIEEHYSGDFSTEFLASLCHVSVSQLRRIFNKIYGISPMEYKRNVVIKMAKQLLKTGDFNISETSDILGFNSVYEFSRFFSKRVGITAKQFQKGK